MMQNISIPEVKVLSDDQNAYISLIDIIKDMHGHNVKIYNDKESNIDDQTLFL